jgi:hypothetical protein
MTASLTDARSKIKSLARRIVRNRELFPAILILIVGIISFGLGRLSVRPEVAVRQRSQEVQVSTFQSGGNTEENTIKDLKVSETDSPQKSGASSLVKSASAAVASSVTQGTTGTARALTSEKKYVASKNSTKYHLPWCSGAARIAEENKVWFASKEEAAAAGYAPAANCKGI